MNKGQPKQVRSRIINIDEVTAQLLACIKEIPKNFDDVDYERYRSFRKRKPTRYDYRPGIDHTIADDYDSIRIHRENAPHKSELANRVQQIVSQAAITNAFKEEIVHQFEKLYVNGV